MPQSTPSTQSTMERVTQQAQSLASQMSDQASKAATALRPNRGRRQARGRLSELVARAPIALPRVPMTTRFAWRAGQATGRVQGASAMAPLAARGWRLALTQRVQIVTARTRQQAQARWLPVSVAGAQIAGRTQQGLRQIQQLPLVTRGAASNGARQVAPKQQAASKQQVAARAQADLARQRLWGAARMFAIGLAIGAAWAYFFAQRRGPGYEALRQRTGDSQS